MGGKFKEAARKRAGRGGGERREEGIQISKREMLKGNKGETS